MARTEAAEHPRIRARERALAALFLSIAVAVSSLCERSRLSGAGAETQPKNPGTATRAKAEPCPFDLSYLPPDATGFIAVRPAALLARPEMKKYRDMLDASLTQILHMPGGTRLSLEAVEQMTGALVLCPRRDEQTGPTSLMSGFRPVMIRTAQDFDWKRKLCRLCEPVRVPFGGKEYYTAAERTRDRSGMAIFDSYFVPDSRTVIFGTAEELRRLILNGPTKRAVGFPFEDWRHVERGFFAGALTAESDIWQSLCNSYKEDADPAVLDLIHHTNAFVVGVQEHDGVAIQARLRCRTRQGCTLVRRRLVELKQESLKEWDASSKGSKALCGADPISDRLQRESLEAAHIEVEGNSACWRVTMRVTLPQLWKLMFPRRMTV